MDNNIIRVESSGLLSDAMQKDYYIVVWYYDPGKPVEVHKKGCQAWKIIDNSVLPPRIFCSYGIIVGPMQQAEKSAERKAKEVGYPGWKKEPCCDDIPCTPRVLGKDIDTKWGRQGTISRTSFDHRKVK